MLYLTAGETILGWIALRNSSGSFARKFTSGRDALLYWARPVELLKVFEFGGGAGPGKKSFELLQF